jgi:hypothetical protein
MKKTNGMFIWSMQYLRAFRNIHNKHKLLVSAQPAAAADPHSRSHRAGSTPALIARGAGFGQGSK